MTPSPTAPSPGQLAGQVAVVTGAGGGIGSVIAETLARDGARVVLADIDQARCADTSDRLSALGLDVSAEHVDVGRLEDVDRLAGRVLDAEGHVDILVNNGAIDAPVGRAWELSPDDWSTVIDVNLSGQWWCTRSFLPSMMGRRRGRVVFISSVIIRTGDFQTSVAYSAAKAGLVGLTIGLSVQLEGFGILVNAIAPGPTGTGRPMTDEERERTLAAIPLGLGGPQPVADACLYLARSSGDWVSGAVLNVSGGMWRG